MNKIHNGWFRIEEEAMRRIANAFDRPCDVRSSMLAYVTLCRVANLRGSDSFEATIGSLSRDMGFVYRDAQKALRLIENLELVKIHRRKVSGSNENAPSIYTVVRRRPYNMSAPTDNMSEGHGEDRSLDIPRSVPKNVLKNERTTSQGSEAFDSWS